MSQRKVGGRPEGIRRYRRWIILAVVVQAPWLLYTGWCWGWIGRSSMVAQYLLQCSCPASSEAVRYPERVDVLFSACEGYIRMAMSPSGRFMSYYYLPGGPPGYLYDFEASTRIDPPTQDFYSLLTDDLLLVLRTRENGGNDFRPQVIDRLSGERRYLEWLSADDLGGEYWDPDPDLLLPLLRGADKVFVLDEHVVILHGYLRDGVPESDYYLDSHWWRQHSLGQPRSRLWQEFFNKNAIEFVLSDQAAGPEFISPSGRFVARQDGIYLVENGQRIVEGYRLGRQEYSRPRGWIYDERGVVLWPAGVHLIDISVSLSLPSIRAFLVRQPTLILRVPGEYLQ